MGMSHPPAIWFPAVRAGTGVDVFTERLVAGLRKRGLRAGITWLPLRAEYAPWTVSVPHPPEWANIVHVNTWLHPRFLPENLPVVATIHHSVHHPDVQVYKGALRAAYHRYWIAPNERCVMRRANRVVAVSRFVAKTAQCTLLDVPVEIIPNGVDIETFRPGRQREPDGPFRLLYVGSWTARKGVDLLAPIMRELGEGFELRYTGGPEAASDKPTMPANMRDIGRLAGDSAVVAAMQDADALLFPSRSEGFGLVAAEAMACGLPVIATRGSSLVEVVEDGVTGILCRQEDVIAFANTVRRLQGDRMMMRRMAGAAQKRVAGLFLDDRTTDSYRGLYDELLARGLGSRRRTSVAK